MQTHVYSLVPRWKPSSVHLWANVFLAIGCLALAFASLFAAWAVAIFVVVFTVKEPASARAVVVLSAVTLGMLALLKHPESDQLYYLWYIDGIREAGLQATSSWNVFSIRETEPLFILYSIFFSNIPDGKTYFIFFSIVIVFMASGLVLTHLAQEKGISALPALAFAFLVSISVFSAGHLIRQYLALSLFMFALAYWLSCQNLRAGILTLVSSAIHNSNIFLLFPIVAGTAFRRFPKTTLGGLTVLAVVGRELLLPYADFFGSLGKNDGPVPLWLILIDAALLFLLILSWWHVRWQDVALDRVVGFSLALTAFLLAVSNLPLLFLRTYVYMEFWRPIVLIMVLSRHSVLRGNWSTSLLIGVSALVFLFRLDNTPWNYGGSAEYVLGLGLPEYVETVSLNYPHWP